MTDQIKDTQHAIDPTVRDIAALARSASARHPEVANDRQGNPRLLTQVLADGPGKERLEILDLDKFGDAAPADLRVRGAYGFADVASLINYAEPFQTEYTTVWVTSDPGRVHVVIDDHAAWGTDDEVETGGGRREHTATVTLTDSTEWKKWAGIHDQLLPQIEFAEFLEDNSLDVLEPTGAALLELVRDFEAVSTGEFVSVQNAVNGDRELLFKETNTESGGSGRIRLPQSITLSLRRYIGEERQEVRCRLRWRKRGAAVAFGVLIDDIDGITERSIDAVRDRLAGTFNRVYLGPGQV